MKYCKLIFVLLSLFFTSEIFAQEFVCKVKVLDNKIQTADAKIFRTLETALTDFLNTQTWSKVKLRPQERIECNFIITPERALDDKNTIFQSTLRISANRPVYMSSYSSPILTHLDNAFSFKYVENQPIQFNELLINTGDAMADNLTAELAYYCYVVLGLYYDSFQKNEGKEYFDKARNIVNNAPKGANITGWSGSENKRGSRYWLVDDLQSPRMAKFHDIWYNYHRMVLDKMHGDQEAPAAELEALIHDFSKLYTGNASSNIVEMFISTKGNEIYDLIANAPIDSRKPMASQMARMHLVRNRDYQKIINESP